MVKVFEKEIRTIQDPEEKQVDALAALKQKEIKPRKTKPNEYSSYFLYGLAKIRASFKPIDYNNLIYNFKDPRHVPTSFVKFKGPNHIFKSIHSGMYILSKKDLKQIQAK